MELVMIFRFFAILAMCAMLLGCPWSRDCGNDVVFSARSIPSDFDSIRVDVYNLQDSLVLSQIDTIVFSSKKNLGYYYYAYRLNITTNLKMSIHCANGWQTFPPVKAKLPSESCIREIRFSYDGSEDRSSSKVIPANPIGNVCEIPDSAVFIISESSCLM